MVKLGFIGCGTHSTNNTYPMLAYTQGRLEAVCDLNEELAVRNATLYGDKNTTVYVDAERMIAECALDGVMIVGSSEMHYQYAMTALKRGIPAYVEKPAAPSLALAESLVAEAKRNNTFIMCGYMKRFGMAYRKIREMIDQEQFNPSAGFFKYAHWNCDNLRDMLMFMSIHIIDLAVYMLGPVETVDSVCGRALGPISLCLTMRHKNGAVSQLMLDSLQPRLQEHIELSGLYNGKNALLLVDNVQHMELHSMEQEASFIDVLAPSLNEIEPHAGFGGISVWRPDYALPNMGQTRHFFQGFAGEAREFVNAIAEKRCASPSNDELLPAMRIIEAVVSNPNGSSKL